MINLIIKSTPNYYKVLKRKEREKGWTFFAGKTTPHSFAHWGAATNRYRFR